MAGHRPDRQQTGHQHPADAGRGPQPAVADVADAEAILGDRRQEGDRAGEQDGEEVERDRAQQHGLAADEAQALERVVQRRALVAGRALLRALRRQRGHQDGGDGEPGGRGGVGHPDGDVVEEAARRRADDEPELPRGRVEGDQPREPTVGRDQRGDRADARRGEGAAGAEDGGDGEDRDRRRRPAAGVDEEGQRGQDLAADGDGRDLATVEAVGRRPGQRQEHAAPAGTRPGRAGRARARCR